jgi:hypothetical protein
VPPHVQEDGLEAVGELLAHKGLFGRLLQLDRGLRCLPTMPVSQRNVCSKCRPLRGGRLALPLFRGSPSR